MGEMAIELLRQENSLYKEGFSYICGVDEVGRGPLAGPVCAAAVILPKGISIDGINDSKKLTAKKREELSKKIKSLALSYSIEYIDEKTIDKINILQATMLAMKNAVSNLHIKPDYVLVDGNRLPELEIPAKAIIKGDSKSQSIAAASILAKVSRDKLMEEFSKMYPQYGFDKHKGYGTLYHRDMLKQYGPCDLHRKSFIRKILSDVRE